MAMKKTCIAIVLCCLTASVSSGCQDQRKDFKRSVNVVTEMANAAAEGNYVAGVAIGEKYLRDNPEDTNVLQQTAILTLAQARQDQGNRELLVSHAVLLVQRALKSSSVRKDAISRFSDGLIAAHAFESAGDLSSNKCLYYKRAFALNDEASKVLTAERLKASDGKEVSTIPLKEQSRKLQSELNQRMSESRCGASL
jgi:hypothetical protein